MPDVKHQKWWGWGAEGVGEFNYRNKPKFAPLVKEKIGVELDEVPVVPHPELEELDIPSSCASEEDLAAIRAVVGDENTVLDDEVRIIHWAGRSIRDLIRTRQSDFTRIPDVVAYPGTEQEVVDLLAAAREHDWVVIPFGGGTSISGSLHAEAGERRTVLSVDLGRLNEILEVDEHSGIARIQAGILGPDLEDRLAARGLTLGHVPDSFTYSTLGGWVATRSSGMQSDKYGDIADMVKGLHLARPGELLVLRDLPSTSTGPSVREMIIGSEGRLGIITQVTVQVHPLPENRRVIAYMLPSFEQALRAMHDVRRSEATPTFARVSDADETAFSLATQKTPTTTMKKASAYGQEKLWAFLRARGWDTDAMCLTYVCYEGSKQKVAHDEAIVKSVIKKYGGISLGSGPGALYDQKKFDTPYIRDFLLDRGGIGDVSETSAPWSLLASVHSNAQTAVQKAFDEIGRQGFLFCHMSHSYHSGACLYFTFAFMFSSPEKALEEYDIVKSALQQSFIDSGATLSHHHGVGTEHSPWMEQDISPAGVDLMAGLLREADPQQQLNPNKILPQELVERSRRG